MTLNRKIIDESIVTTTGGEQMYYTFKDHQGSLAAVGNGNTAYDPSRHLDIVYDRLNFPKWVVASSSYTLRRNDYGVRNRNRHLFGGKELQDEALAGITLNLYDFEARTYDPTIGRFLNVDPLAEKYYGLSPFAYCGNDPICFIDVSGSEVKPAGNSEMTMIRNTLPKEARRFVKIDRNGMINKELLNSYNGNSLNFNNLKTLVNSNIIVEIVLNNEFSYRNQNGTFGVESMSYFPYDSNYPEDIDANGDTPSGLSSGETGFLGKTLFPDLKGLQNSPNDNIIVIINMNLSPEGAAETYSHEANGHALLYIINGGDHNGASHDFKGSEDLNKRLEKMIIESKKETIKNMKEL